MELSFEQIRSYFEHRHPGQRIPARTKLAVKCAFHSENNPSCTLYLDGNGGFNCHACGAKGNLFQFETRFSSCDIRQAEINIAEITGATPTPRFEGEKNLGPPVALYDYRDENGIVLFQKRRFEPEMEKKTFRTFRPTDKGWKAGIDPKEGTTRTRRVLFNLPDVVKANVVFVCEGEKDCLNILTANLFASAGYSIACTTSFDGAWEPRQSPKWIDNYNAYFAGKMVFIFQDNDESGKEYAEYVATSILRYAYSVRIITFTDLAEKSDVSDYLKEHSTAELEEKIKASQVWTGTTVERRSYIVDALDWALTANPQVDWLVDGVIQAGANGIIAAEPKTGKSLCSLDLLISMACGRPWLGRSVPRRVKCAYISREDSPILTKIRVKALLRGKGLLADPTDWLWINTREQLGDFNVDNDEIVANMIHDLKERQIEFAIFDVLNRLHQRDENNNSEMTQVFAKINHIGQQAGCSIGIVHHVSKENGATGRFFTRIRGASSIHGWTEWSIGLSIESLGDATKTTIRKAEFETKAGESCATISFTIEPGNESLSVIPVGGKKDELYQPALSPGWKKYKDDD